MHNIRKNILFSFILIIFNVFSIVTEAQENEKVTLGILNLGAKGVSNLEADILSDKLRYYISILVASEEFKNAYLDKYEVVERTEMDKIFNEFDLVNCVSDSCALEFGKMLQADRMILGSVGKL